MGRFLYPGDFLYLETFSYQAQRIMSGKSAELGQILSDSSQLHLCQEILAPVGGAAVVWENPKKRINSREMLSPDLNL